MPIKSSNKKLVAGFLAAIIVFGCFRIVSYRTIVQLQVADNWVAHTIDVIDCTSRVQSDLSNAERSEIYYLLNGSTKNYHNYNQAARSLSIQLDSLRRLVSDNQPQVNRVDSLIKYSSLKASDIELAVEGKRLNNLEVIQQHLIIDSENTPFDKCRFFAVMIIQTERNLLTARKTASYEKVALASKMILIYSIIIILLLVFLFTFIFRTFINKRKLREQLQLSESKFSKAFYNSGSGMALVSTKGEWLEVNPFLLSLLGYEKEQLLAKTFQDISHPEDLDKDLDLLGKLLNGEVASYRREKRYLHENGGILWVLLSVSPIHNEDGTVRLFVTQVEDITKIKVLINELEDRNNALLALSEDLNSKVAQLEEFNRIVAHNLRGPAGSIQMMLEMLQDEGTQAGKEELLTLILVSSKSLNATLADLMQVLEVRLNRSMAFDTCNLNQILVKTNQMLQGEILVSKVLISTDFALENILFPRIYMESLFYNMLSNSLKYRQTDLPLQIKVSSKVVNSKTQLIFEDNGLGIDLNANGKNMFKLNKVFHKGFNSKGVGLFITKNQLETHGASIEVESEALAGTKFIVTF
jgi:PAS domain S-box-containing protein